ncbi:hypothetical protein [Komagataeibacter europaeus]|uniref:hypothetical protein n=1 Tax=Komagataeibacter europaeus TaxID=33995 RepID=UPI0002F7C661|nr:hypothetical protein [Komagataeibacter europaeus]
MSPRPDGRTLMAGGGPHRFVVRPGNGTGALPAAAGRTTAHHAVCRRAEKGFSRTYMRKPAWRAGRDRVSCPNRKDEGRWIVAWKPWRFPVLCVIRAMPS